MNGKSYWKQKIPVLFLNGSGMAALALFLRLNGINADSIILIEAVWGTAAAVSLLTAYFTRKAQMDKLLALAEQLEERYLLPEVMERPVRADDQVYYQILKLAGRSR